MPSPSRSVIAIIGGGLSGLHAARLLHRANVDFILLEARDRFGGRILTADESGQPGEDGFDLGPSWYWPRMQPALAALIAELGLASFAQNVEGDVIFERMSRETPERFRGIEVDQQSMRIVGGTSALMRALVGAVPQDKLLLGVRVTAMTLVDNGVELTILRAGGSVEKVVVTRVIAALPPRLMEASIAFTPEQEMTTARRWREAPTWMAPHAKFFALYDRPFWRNSGLCGTAQSMVGPMAEIHDATTASGKPGLFGFLGVGAEQRSTVPQDALAQACLAQFARLFGPEALEPRATLYKDWAADPLTATPADRAGGSHIVPSAAPWVSGPWRDRLSLAGSETSLSEPGYLAGAIAAAERAVDEILAAGDRDRR